MEGQLVKKYYNAEEINCDRSYKWIVIGSDGRRYISAVRPTWLYGRWQTRFDSALKFIGYVDSTLGGPTECYELSDLYPFLCGGCYQQYRI